MALSMLEAQFRDILRRQERADERRLLQEQEGEGGEGGGEEEGHDDEGAGEGGGGDRGAQGEEGDDEGAGERQPLLGTSRGVSYTSGGAGSGGGRGNRPQTTEGPSGEHQGQKGDGEGSSGGGEGKGKGRDGGAKGEEDKTDKGKGKGRLDSAGEASPPRRVSRRSVSAPPDAPEYETGASLADVSPRTTLCADADRASAAEASLLAQQCE